MTEELRKLGRRRRVLRVLYLLLALGVLLWFVVPPKVATTPVHFVRQAGKLVAEDGRTWPPVQTFSINISRSAAHDGLTSTASSSSPDGSRLPCARLAVVAGGNDLLTRRISECLVPELGKQAFINDITYYPGGLPLPAGIRKPDLIIVVTAARPRESGFAITHTVKTSVHVTASPQIAALSNGSLDFETIPCRLTGINWTGNLEHDSTTVGLYTRSLRYQQAAASIAGQVGASLGKYCADQLKPPGGLLPELPAAFYPPYQSPPAFPALTQYGAKQLLATHGLLTTTDACWAFDAQQPPSTVLPALNAALRREGWKPQFPITSGNYAMTLIARGNTRFLHVMAQYRKKAPYHYDVRYVACLPKVERERLINDLLAKNPAPEMVTLFLSSFPPERKRALLLTLHQATPGTVLTWLTLAQLEIDQGRRTDARAALQRAHILLRTIEDGSSYLTRIDELTKKVGTVADTLTPALLKSCGFQRLGKPGTQQKYPVLLGQSLLFYWPSRDDGIATIAVHLANNNAGTVECRYITKTEHMSSSSQEEYTGSRLSYIAPVDLVGMIEILTERDPNHPAQFVVTANMRLH
ncbi:MAG: hypothetical protein ACYDBB_22105 [Armatimonadota bacterium]